MESKYGKPYGNDMLKIKGAFFKDNDELLDNSLRINKMFTQQPEQLNCRICGEKLNQKDTFCSHGVKYSYCPICHHLNGMHVETEEFCSQVYQTDNYGHNYKTSDLPAYQNRIKTIYQPKMDFLLEHLKNEGLEKQEIKMLDVGAGSGYFVGAGLEKEIDILGIEVSEQQVEFGNQMLKNNKLNQVDISDVAAYIEQSDRNVISFIGVLEHLTNLNEILSVIHKNDNIKYIYYSVPLFSYSCVLEAVFSNVFNRQLGGTHTHLFTLDSIQYMNDKYDFVPVTKWQFGTDVMDLYRSIIVSLGGENSFLKNIFSEKFLSCADDLQLVLDKSDFCSEVHMLVRKSAV